MTDDLARELYEAALGSARSAADRAGDGEGVAAAAATASGRILHGVWVDAMVDSACLCAETGPICEAHRTRDALVAIVCVRWRGTAGATVLAACGVCQERLAVFGATVLVGVSDAEPPGYRFRPLADLRPSPWWDAVS